MYSSPNCYVECDDPEWVAEHSMQVSRMLVGGLHVRGVYLLETNEKWSEYPTILTHPPDLIDI